MNAHVAECSTGVGLWKRLSSVRDASKVSLDVCRHLVHECHEVLWVARERLLEHLGEALDLIRTVRNDRVGHREAERLDVSRADAGLSLEDVVGDLFLKASRPVGRCLVLVLLARELSAVILDHLLEDRVEELELLKLILDRHTDLKDAVVVLHLVDVVPAELLGAAVRSGHLPPDRLVGRLIAPLVLEGSSQLDAFAHLSQELASHDARLVQRVYVGVAWRAVVESDELLDLKVSATLRHHLIAVVPLHVVVERHLENVGRLAGDLDLIGKVHGITSSLLSQTPH